MFLVIHAFRIFIVIVSSYQSYYDILDISLTVLKLSNERSVRLIILQLVSEFMFSLFWF